MAADYIFGRYARSMPCARKQRVHSTYMGSTVVPCGKPATQYYYERGNSTRKIAVCDDHAEQVKALILEKGMSYAQAERDNKSRADSWKRIRSGRRSW